VFWVETIKFGSLIGVRTLLSSFIIFLPFLHFVKLKECLVVAASYQTQVHLQYRGVQDKCTSSDCPSWAYRYTFGTSVLKLGDVHKSQVSVLFIWCANISSGCLNCVCLSIPLHVGLELFGHWCKSTVVQSAIYGLASTLSNSSTERSIPWRRFVLSSSVCNHVPFFGSTLLTLWQFITLLS